MLPPFQPGVAAIYTVDLRGIPSRRDPTSPTRESHRISSPIARDAASSTTSRCCSKKGGKSAHEASRRGGNKGSKGHKSTVSGSEERAGEEAAERIHQESNLGRDLIGRSMGGRNRHNASLRQVAKSETHLLKSGPSLIY